MRRKMEEQEGYEDGDDLAEEEEDDDGEDDEDEEGCEDDHDADDEDDDDEEDDDDDEDEDDGEPDEAPKNSDEQVGNDSKTENGEFSSSISRDRERNQGHFSELRRQAMVESFIAMGLPADLVLHAANQPDASNDTEAINWIMERLTMNKSDELEGDSRYF